MIRVMAVILTAIDKAREFQKNIYFCLLTTRKPLTLWITTKCGKFFKRWEYQSPYLPPEKSVCRSRSNSQNQTWNNSSVQFSSVTQSCLILCNPMDCSTPGFPVLRLLKLMSIESVMPSNQLILCHPFSSCLQSFPASWSFLMSWFFTSSGQSVGTLASASVLPMNIQG